MAFVETWTGQHEGRRRARPVDTNTETQEPNHQRPANSGSTVNVTGELASGGRPHDVACRQRRRAAQRLAAIGGTGRRDFRAGWTGRRATRGPRTAGRRGSPGGGESSTTQSVARPRAWAVGLAGDGGPTSGSTSRPTPALPQPLAARPSRPRATPPPRGRLPWPPCHRSRAVHC